MCARSKLLVDVVEWRLNRRKHRHRTSTLAVNKPEASPDCSGTLKPKGGKVSGFSPTWMPAMPTLRVTAILKTDISGSTPRFRNLPQADLTALLTEHREFVHRLAEGKEGRIIKAQGDGFWIAFPSVTAAALASMAMQEELRRSQLNKGDDRLAMRIVITLGDVLHEEGDLFGDAVALTARIEAVTPPNEIYMSAAARLAVNQAEVRTALVDAFALRGFPEPVPVYRVEQTHRTQVIAGQYILWDRPSRFREVRRHSADHGGRKGSRSTFGTRRSDLPGIRRHQPL
jgi:class 3 adenylate cyclase